MASCLKNILFQIGDANTHILQMERYGYLRGSTFCFVDVLPQEAPDSDVMPLLERYGIYAESIARSISELFIYFTYQNSLVLVLVDYSDHEIHEFVSQLRRELSRPAAGSVISRRQSQSSGNHESDPQFPPGAGDRKNWPDGRKKKFSSSMIWIFPRYCCLSG